MCVSECVCVCGRDPNNIIEHETVSINGEIIARKRYKKKTKKIIKRQKERETI